MQKLIEKKDIDSLYKKVGLNPTKNFEVSSILNTGTLNNKLNQGNLEIKAKVKTNKK